MAFFQSSFLKQFIAFREEYISIIPAIAAITKSSKSWGILIFGLFRKFPLKLAKNREFHRRNI